MIHRSIVLIAALALLGCRDHAASDDHGKPAAAGAGSGSGSGSAAPAVVIDWPRCMDAIAKAPALPDPDRVPSLIAACPVCGDWRPILDWARLQQNGGPSRLAIDTAMKACEGYCNADAHDRFLGTLDDARGVANNRTPWHYLADACKEKVSADADRERFVTAPYFALDRIVRAAGKHDASAAAALAKVTIALPPVALTGNGLVLPEVDGATSLAGPLAASLIGADLRIAYLPRGQLGPDGITLVPTAGERYPGALATKPVDMLRALAGDQPQPPVAVLAPRGLPATRLVDAIAALTPSPPTAHDGPRRLAVTIRRRDDTTPPQSWPIPRVAGPALVSTLPPGALVIGLTADGFIGRADDGKTINRAVHIAPGPAPLPERLLAAIAQRRPGIPLAIAVGPDVKVSDLAALVTNLPDTEVVALGAWPPPTSIAQAFDPAILEAARPGP